MESKASKSKKIIIIFGIYITFVFLSYAYRDMVVTQRHGIAFWDALWSGQLLNYYKFCIDNTAVPAVYSISIYILFAIWNIPCWIYERISGADALESAIWIFYGKGLIFSAYILTIIQFKNICRKIEDIFANSTEKVLHYRYVVVLYATSMILICYSVFTGNYDVLELVFILAGIDAIIDQKEKKFILYFAMATSMKFFAIWIFIPIVLLREKRIINILIKTALCSSVTIIEDLIFNTSKILRENEYAQQFIADKGFEIVANAGNIANLGIGPVSLCFILYFLLCLYCYLQCIDEPKMYVMKTIYVSFVAWSIFFSTVGFNCYWLVLIIPFLALLCMFNEQNRYINILFEMALSSALLLNTMLRQSWVLGSEWGYSTHAIISGVLIKIFGMSIPTVETIGDLLGRYNVELPIYAYVNSMIIIMFIAIIIMNYPGYRVQKSLPKIMDSKCKFKNCYLIRCAFHLVVVLLPTMYYVYQVIAYNIINK